MPPSDAPTDPEMPSNLPPPSQGPNKRLQQNQAQVDEVVDIMKVNMEKVLERDSKLSKLDDRADALQAGASQFEASAGKLKNKFWWKNMKMNIMIGGVVLLVVIVLGWSFFGGKNVNLPWKSAPAPVVMAPPAAEESDESNSRMRRETGRGVSFAH